MNENGRANKVMIANIPIPTADKEVTWALPKGCRWFTLQVRDGTPLRIAVESGKVAASQPPYFTILANNSWDEKQLGMDIGYGIPLFLACGVAGKVVEVVMGIHDPSIDGGE